LRLPRDDLGLAWRGGRLGTKVAWTIAFSLLCRRGLGRLRYHRLAVTERVYGLLQTGQMHESYVVELLRRLDVPTAELYFHPSVVFLGEAFGPNPGDLATLLSPAVRQVVRERGLRLATYRDLSSEVSTCF
jgi:hypothetical protein